MKKKLGTAIGLMVLIYMSLCGNYINKGITNNMIFLYGLIDFLIINTLMSIVPLSLKLLNKINIQNGKKICKYNSLIIFILSVLTTIVLKEYNYFGIGGLGAIFYYFINLNLFVQNTNNMVNKYKTQKNNNQNNIKENDKWQEIKNEESLQINDTSSMAQDDILENNIYQNDEKKVDNENNTFLKTLSVILGIFLLIAIIIIFSLLIKNEKQKIKLIEQEDKINNINSNKNYYKNLSKEMQEKINFYDKYIVIIPQDSNYYMSYDCWDKKGRSDTFNIMNYKDAQINGYREYTCNIREKLGISE